MDFRAVSVNPDDRISVKADEMIFKLFKESNTKTGRLATFNQLKYFLNNLKEERINAISVLREKEKWFQKGVRFIAENRPYKEKEDRDTETVTRLLKTYPSLQFDNFLDNYGLTTSVDLVSMLHYIDSNMEYIQQTTMGNLGNSANELRSKILSYDWLHVLCERTVDFIDLLISKNIGEEILKNDFVRSIEQVKNSKKLGRKLDSDAPQEAIDEVVQELVKRALSKESGFEKFIHQKGAYQGKANRNQILKYIESVKPEIRGELTNRAFLDRIKKALPHSMK